MINRHSKFKAKKYPILHGKFSDACVDGPLCVYENCGLKSHRCPLDLHNRVRKWNRFARRTILQLNKNEISNMIFFRTGFFSNRVFLEHNSFWNIILFGTGFFSNRVFFEPGFFRNIILFRTGFFMVVFFVFEQVCFGQKDICNCTLMVSKVLFKNASRELLKSRKILLFNENQCNFEY